MSAPTPDAAPVDDVLVEQAEQRVYTNDVDALEALIVAGLPPDEMQAAAWVLVQRVRSLREDLQRFQTAFKRHSGMKLGGLSEEVEPDA